MVDPSLTEIASDIEQILMMMYVVMGFIGVFIILLAGVFVSNRKTQELEYLDNETRKYSSLATVLQEQGKYDELRDRSNEVLKYRPDSAEAHYYLGFAFMNLGRLSEAKSSFAKSAESNPQWAEVCEVMLAEVNERISASPPKPVR